MVRDWLPLEGKLSPKVTDEVDALRTTICLLTQRIHHIRPPAAATFSSRRRQRWLASP